MLDRNNIINVREGESLYQICIKLRRRLSGVPGFQPYLEEMEDREHEGSDPVSSLWQCFRTGLPLLTIYNASDPEGGELTVKTSVPEKIGKEAAFKFIKACHHEMKIPMEDIFSIIELYSDNTTGFVKVTKLVNKVLDILAMSGKLQASSSSTGSGNSLVDPDVLVPKSPKRMTRRDHILKELVNSERHYVHHLQNLQAMKKELEEAGAVTGDTIHHIFLNLNNLLDFAQRFLIRIEQQYELPDEDQNWGQLFVRYKEPFRQYEPFIANQKRCEVTVSKEWSTMERAARSTLMRQMLANPTILNGFLLKPFQRLTKYPLLLKDLRKQTESEVLCSDLDVAISIIQDVLNQADASIDKETREDAVKDLQERIDDFKGLNLASLGELLLIGTFNVLKESPLSKEEKEYHVYLFARILVMCKDVNAAKQKKKGLAAVSVGGKPKLHVKGRIYFANVITMSMSAKAGDYLLNIIWKGEKGDASTDQFVIRFKNEETLKKWHDMMHTQRSSCMLERSGGANVSSTKLTSLANIDLPNPYAEQDDDDPDYSRMSSTTYGDADLSMSRNASSTSLRQRSATGSSGASSNPHMSTGRIRGPPLNTSVQSPGQYTSDSYFSPIDRESTPQSASTRSSAQSAYAASYKQQIPTTNVHDSNYRNTAPAMGRDHRQGNPYIQQNGRHPVRPSLPSGSIQSANNVPLSRMRSASSPDIHPQVQQHRKYGENIPAVPSIPSNVSKQTPAPNRGHPNLGNHPSMRNVPLAQASQMGHRPPMAGHGYTYDPSFTAVESRKLGHGQQQSVDRTMSYQAVPPSANGESMLSQLRAKIRFDDNYVSMIIPINITFRSLTDRIDAKLARFTNHAISAGMVKLRYQDQDGDYVLIDSDEAVSEALLDWRETHADQLDAGINAEISLFAHVVHE